MRYNATWLRLPLVLILAVIGSGCGSLETYIDNHVEVVGTELTEVPVTVAEVDLQIARGAGEIRGLRVANPPGYTDEYAMTWDLVHLNLGIASSLVGEPIVLDTLVISYPAVNFERNERGGSNLGDIAERAERNQGPADQAAAEHDGADEPVRLIIRELLIEGVTLNVRGQDGSVRSVILPRIALADVGGDQGVTPGGLGVIITGAMAGEMLKQVIARELIERAGDIRDAFSVDNLLDTIDEKLYLTAEQRERIRPVVEEFRETLLALIERWREQGYVDRGDVEQTLAPILAVLSEQLEPMLNREQREDLDVQLNRLADNGVEIIRHLIVLRIATRLELTPDQVRELRPVLHEYLVQISAIVDSAARNPDWSGDYLLALFENRGDELRARLRERLSPEQLRIISAIQEEIRNRLKAEFRML